MKTGCGPSAGPSRGRRDRASWLTRQAAGAAPDAAGRTRERRGRRAEPDVDVQAEGVVALRDVLQPLLDAPVVLGVDDRLLAVVRPWVCAGGAQRCAATLGQGKQAAAAIALPGHRVVEIGAGSGDDLDLRGDQLAGDALVQLGVGGRGGGAQLLKARHQVEGDRIQDRELLFEADGEVGCAGEGLVAWSRSRSKWVMAFGADGWCGACRTEDARRPRAGPAQVR